MTLFVQVKNPARVFPLALSVAVMMSTLCYLLPIAVAVCTKAGMDDSAWTDIYLSTAIAEDIGGQGFKVTRCVPQALLSFVAYNYLPVHLADFFMLLLCYQLHRYVL